MLAAVAACAAVPVAKQRALQPPPAWIDSPPPDRGGKVYAVGHSGPTLFPADGMRYAADDARGKLALSMHQQLESIGMSAEKTSSNAGYDLEKQATDVVMQNSRIEATWIDEHGQLGDAGTIWALAVLDRSGADAVASSAVTSAIGKLGPGWLDNLPASGGKAFAVGYSGPTFEPETARQNASETAIENLASSLRAHVQAYTLLIEDKTGLSIDEFSRTDDPEETFRELVKKSAKVELIWVDAKGVRPGGEKGGVWALASIPVTSTKGGVSAVQNQDLGPALDPHGNAPAPVPTPAPQSPDAPPAAAR